ncbi:hypothetical protein CTAYLR_003791 [Chrysophaeum taylorii]|uniref:Tubulin-tyrosine ligase family protein n=1 Tax=Chrysophaeum taylorii TaxID=2483200 RepID=A0AAD7UD16_9STRA|nr:hypothetical protein CTAYLR_003791 [Chrysophaeum taylorii]
MRAARAAAAAAPPPAGAAATTSSDDDVLIQLDHIPGAATDRLEHLQSCSHLFADDEGPLGAYVRRQDEAIREELRKRRSLGQSTRRLEEEASSSSWGKTFVVAGGDGGLARRAREQQQRKKICRGKAVVLAVDQQRRERRKAAISRLQARRQQRIDQRAIRRRRRAGRLGKTNAPRPTCSSSSSSDSESVSDDDDEDAPSFACSERQGAPGDAESGLELSRLRVALEPEEEEAVEADARRETPPKSLQEAIVEPRADARRETEAPAKFDEEAASSAASLEAPLSTTTTTTESAEVVVVVPTEEAPPSTTFVDDDDELEVTAEDARLEEEEEEQLPQVSPPTGQQDAQAAAAAAENDDSARARETTRLDEGKEESVSPQNIKESELDTQEVALVPRGEDRITEGVLSTTTTAAAAAAAAAGAEEEGAEKGRGEKSSLSPMMFLAKRKMIDFGLVHGEWCSIFSQWSRCAKKRHRPPPGDVRVAMARQWRLYAAFEAIMADYGAVFGEQSDGSKEVYAGDSSALHFRVNSSRPEVFDIVSQVLGQCADWVELPSGLGLKTTWNLLWTWSKPRIDYAHLLAWQRVNHYPNSRQLTRKDLFARAVGRYQKLVSVAPESTARRLAGAFDIVPKTFLLPQDYVGFVDAWRAKPPGSLWIMKPVGLSRGRGISLASDLEDVRYSEPVVIQEYLAAPLLLDSHKFDLRLYVLVTSFSPLEVFIYRSGFARVATREYSIDSLRDKIVHLTNASIQRKSGESCAPLRFASPEEAGGTKCSLEYLRRRLEATRAVERGWFDDAWREICILVLKSLVCVEDSIPHQPNSFEVFGYDVILDQGMRPWLLEVNASPSMARDTRLDCLIKEAMIRDTVGLVAPLRYDRARLVEVMDRRLRAAEARRAYDERLLNADLNLILLGVPRRYGEPPSTPGAYEQLAPGPLHDYVRRIKRSIITTAATS